MVFTRVILKKGGEQMTPGTFLTPDKSFMNLMNIDPFRMLNRPTRLFTDPFTMFRPFLASDETMPMMAWTPPCDIYETDKEVVVKMELPEVKKEDVHVTVEHNLLTIRGERKFEEKVDRENYHRIERTYGEFMRSFTLPTYVENNKIFADFHDGLLMLTLPKKEEARPKQIEVKVN
jgi:HSP20 family protein